MKSIKYGVIAELYDAFVQTALDIPFFINEVKKAKGDVLELMSGTGRVSIPLLKEGAALTCVDKSPEMLTMLGEKMEKHNLTAPVYEMDVRNLNLFQKYRMAIMPFHSFSELISTSDQRKTMSAVYRHLHDDGIFICPLHNPSVRLKKIDENLRLWARRNLHEKQRTLLVFGLEKYDRGHNIVSGMEFFEEYTEDGLMVSKRFMETRFRLFSMRDFKELAISEKFKIESLYGDYSYSDYQEESSPYMVWVLRK